ncbi:hypothetical protein VSPL_49970 [Vibrio splendidus]|nr:hypothetical protein VSPL_49970 [Vibrio splendidus]
MILYTSSSYDVLIVKKKVVMVNYEHRTDR